MMTKTSTDAKYGWHEPLESEQDEHAEEVDLDYLMFGAPAPDYEALNEELDDRGDPPYESLILCGNCHPELLAISLLYRLAGTR